MARAALAQHRNGTGTKTAKEKSERVTGVVSMGPGWTEHEVKQGEGLPVFKVPETDTSYVVKFAENGYFYSYLQHWIAKNVYPCFGDDCPGCARGVKQSPVYCFNVVDMGEHGKPAKDPELKIWFATPGPFQAVKKRAEDSTVKDISRNDMYFAVSKTPGKNGINEFEVAKIKVRDLEEDYGIEPLTDKELERLTAELFTQESINMKSREDLVEAVKNMKDDE